MPENPDPGPNGPDSKLARSWDSAQWLFVAMAAGALARTPRSLDELRKLTINALALLAVGLIAFIAYQAFHERLLKIEPITILKSLETENGYTSAIVARRLIDQVEHINATARTRVEGVKVGQEGQFSSLSNFQVPASGLTLQTFVSLLRAAFELEDERIGGEITIKLSDEVPAQTVYQMRLRFDIKQEASDRPVRRAGNRRFVKVLESPRLNTLIERSAQAIVEITAPDVLASYLYGARNWKELDKLLNRLVESSKPEVKPRVAALMGMRLLEKCDVSGSLEWLKKAVDADKSSVFARVRYGDALIKANRPDEAIREFEQVPERFAGRAYSSWAKALLRKHGPGEDGPKAALAFLEQSHVAAVRSSRIYRTRGDILSMQQKYKDAAEEYRIAVGLDPESSTAYDSWGTVLLADGDLPGAIEKFRLAIEADEWAPGPHYHLIDGLHRQGDVRGIVLAFRHMADVVEEHAMQLSAMAHDLARAPQPGTASEMVKTIMKTERGKCGISKQEARL